MGDERGGFGRHAWAAFTVFAVEAFSYASWLPRLPEIKAALGLSDGALGLVLFALPCGALVAIPGAGWGSTRASLRRLTLGCLLWMYGATLAIALARSAAGLGAVLFAVGLGTGATGVAMNAVGVDAERRTGRAVLSRCHAAFSLGMAAGGFAAAGFLRAGAPLPLQLVAVHVALLVPSAFALRGVSDELPGARAGDARGTPGRRFAPALLAPAAVALGCLLAEGAALDWSPVYLARILGPGSALVASGIVAFALAMAAARFAGDAMAERFGPRRLAGGGALLAAAGYALAASAPGAAPACAGFLAVGLGLAPIAPIAFRSGAALSPGAPGVGVAAVSSAGYVGFLIGPALVGAVAEAAGLRWAFAALGLVLVGVGGLALAAMPPAPRRPAGA